MKNLIISQPGSIAVNIHVLHNRLPYFVECKPGLEYRPGVYFSCTNRGQALSTSQANVYDIKKVKAAILEHRLVYTRVCDAVSVQQDLQSPSKPKTSHYSFPIPLRVGG